MCVQMHTHKSAILFSCHKITSNSFIASNEIKFRILTITRNWTLLFLKDSYAL